MEKSYIIYLLRLNKTHIFTCTVFTFVPVCVYEQECDDSSILDKHFQQI